MDAKVILSHVASSETVMLVFRLLKFVEKDDRIYIKVGWEGLSTSECTLEPLEGV